MSILSDWKQEEVINEQFKLKPMGANLTAVFLGETEIWFSYETPIAFRSPKGTFATAEKFSATTSRHMNAIPWIAKATKLEEREFEGKIKEYIG